MASRTLTALLVPAGVVLGHLGGYALAGGSGRVDHSHLGELLVVAAVLAGVGLLWAAAAGPARRGVAGPSSGGAAPIPRRGRACGAPRADGRLLVAGQLLAYAALEVGERVAVGLAVPAAAGETAVWAGLALQVVAAGLLVVAVRWVPTLTAALLPPSLSPRGARAPAPPAFWHRTVRPLPHAGFPTAPVRAPPLGRVPA